MDNDAWFEPLQQQTQLPDTEVSDVTPDVHPGTSDVETGPSGVNRELTRLGWNHLNQTVVAWPQVEMGVIQFKRT